MSVKMYLVSESRRNFDPQKTNLFENRCMHCKTCIAKSKNQGVTMENDQIHIHPNRNENWNTIIDWCPTGAIAMDSREMSVEMVMEEIRKDKSFYRYGNGGVTISGGEPLLQWKFTKELLKACKKKESIPRSRHPYMQIRK